MLGRVGSFAHGDRSQPLGSNRCLQVLGECAGEEDRAHLRPSTLRLAESKELPRSFSKERDDSHDGPILGRSCSMYCEQLVYSFLNITLAECAADESF
ncbi:UNVERIFIED_CONTAM: hypothetical protein FKN15_056371 [Acipenser sinensis]